MKKLLLLLLLVPMFLFGQLKFLPSSNGEYIDSTDKFIDVSFGSSGNWMTWLHIGDLNNDGLVKLFNDELHGSNNSSAPYREWELINGKFILKQQAYNLQ